MISRRALARDADDDIRLWLGWLPTRVDAYALQRIGVEPVRVQPVDVRLDERERRGEVDRDRRNIVKRLRLRENLRDGGRLRRMTLDVAMRRVARRRYGRATARRLVRLARVEVEALGREHREHVLLLVRRLHKRAALRQIVLARAQLRFVLVPTLQ